MTFPKLSPANALREEEEEEEGAAPELDNKQEGNRKRKLIAIYLSYDVLVMLKKFHNLYVYVKLTYS